MREYDTVMRELTEYHTRNPAVYVFVRTMSAGDNPYLHVIPHERDTDIVRSTLMMPAGNGGRKLVKFTTAPTNDDRSMFSAHATLYGSAKCIMEYLLAENCLDTSVNSLDYCRYFETDDVKGILDNVCNEYPGINIAYS